MSMGHIERCSNCGAHVGSIECRARRCPPPSRADVVAAERDAAVARNMRLVEEIAELKAEMIPVADFALECLKRLGREAERYEKRGRETGHDRFLSRAEGIEEALEIVRGVEGWTGSEGEPPSAFCLADTARQRAREQALRAAVAAQWADMVTVADWCEAFAVDPEVETSWKPYFSTGGVWVVFMNLAARRCAEQIVDGAA